MSGKIKEARTAIFTFHFGAINTNHLPRCNRYWSNFTFHFGAINTLLQSGTPNALADFTFHFGAINTKL